MADLMANQLARVALALADNLDYARGADSLGISEQELRDQIKLIEAELCLQLFDDSSGKPALTREGRFLVARIRPMLADRAFNVAVETHDLDREEPE